MLKFILLILIFMTLIFAAVATIIPGSQTSTNPVTEIGKEFTKPLSKVDEITPDISNALNSVKLPGLPVKSSKEAKGEMHALTDQTGVVFSNKDLPKANFAGSLLSLTAFDGALLDGAILEGANGDDVNFKSARMAKANLSATAMPGADFSGAELREATARAADFAGANFAGADISFAAFSGAQLGGADFRKAYGAGSIFVGADLSNAKFTGADLTGVRLAHANLQDAVFEAADMKLADLSGANLHGADLSGALNLTAEQLSKACADGGTKLPEGLAAPRC